MTRLVVPTRALLLFAMVLSGLTGGTSLAGAQFGEVEPDYYLSSLSDLEIEISGRDYEIFEADEQTYPHGEGEVVQVSSRSANIQIAFFDDTDTNSETLEFYIQAFDDDVDDFEILDEEEDGEVVHTFAAATYNEIQILYYVSVTEDVVGNVDVLQQIYAPDTTFFEDLAEAQDDITLDGEGLFGEVDVDDLEALAAGSENTSTDDEASGERERSSSRNSSRGDMYEFQLVPAEMTLAGDVSVLDSSYEAPAVEQVQLALGTPGSLGLIQMMQNPMDAEASLDFFLRTFNSSFDSLDNLGTDADDTSAWSLDIGEVDGDAAILYIHVDNERYRGFHYIEMLLSSEQDFLDDIESLNRDVEVDGEGMFASADVGELESLLDGEDPSDARGNDGESGSNRRTDTGNDERDEQSRERADDEADDLDLASQGLLSESEFESLQHDVVVEWDDGVWEVDPTWELSAVPDTQAGIDSVILFWLDGSASIMIQILPGNGEEAADFVGLWESADYIADVVHEDAEVLISDSGRYSGAVVYLTYDNNGGDLILVQEAIDIDGGETFAMVTMFGSPDDVVDAYRDIDNRVTIDGIDGAGTFTPREIERTITP